MSLWTSKFWGRALTTHVKHVYNALHGLMGQSLVTPGLTRGLGSREARSSSVDKGASCAEATDSDTGHVMHGAVPGTSESMDIDKPIITVQSSQTPAKAQEAARAMVLDEPTAVQELHSEQASLRQQGTAEPMAEESTLTLRQRPARQYKSRQVRRQLLTHQPPITPQKRRSPTQLQPSGGMHRSKRKHRERRPPQAAASGQKRLAVAEADISHSKLPRKNAKTWPLSQNSQASMEPAEISFARGLRPRKAEQTQPGFYARKAGKSLRDPKQGAGASTQDKETSSRALPTKPTLKAAGSQRVAPEASSLDKAALQPHCAPAPAASADRPQARALQLTEGRCSLRPRKARQPIAGTKASATTKAAAAAPAVSSGHAATDSGTLAAEQKLAPKFPAFLKLEWRQASPDAARIFSRLATLKCELGGYLKRKESSNEACSKPLPPFRPRLSCLRFETRPADDPAIPLAARAWAERKMDYLRKHNGSAPEPSHKDFAGYLKTCRGCHGYSLDQLLIRSAEYRQSVQRGLLK